MLILLHLLELHLLLGRELIHKVLEVAWNLWKLVQLRIYQHIKIDVLRNSTWLLNHLHLKILELFLWVNSFYGSWWRYDGSPSFLSQTLLFSPLFMGWLRSLMTECHICMNLKWTVIFNWLFEDLLLFYDHNWLHNWFFLGFSQRWGLISPISWGPLLAQSGVNLSNRFRAT